MCERDRGAPDTHVCECNSVLAHITLLLLCRETDQVVDEHFQDSGPHKPIKFDEKYAKRFGVQYLVSHTTRKRLCRKETKHGAI